MNNLTVNDNKEIVYKEVELVKPSGRVVENITHMPEAYNEHFTRKFDEIMRYSIIYIYILKILKKNPSTVGSNYFILKFGQDYSKV